MDSDKILHIHNVTLPEVVDSLRIATDWGAMPVIMHARQANWSYAEQRAGTVTKELPYGEGSEPLPLPDNLQLIWYYKDVVCRLDESIKYYVTDQAQPYLSVLCDYALDASSGPLTPDSTHQITLWHVKDKYRKTCITAPSFKTASPNNIHEIVNRLIDILLTEDEDE